MDQIFEHPEDTGSGLQPVASEGSSCIGVGYDEHEVRTRSYDVDIPDSTRATTRFFTAQGEYWSKKLR